MTSSKRPQNWFIASALAKLLQYNEKQLSVLNEISSHITGSLELDQVLNSAVREVTQVMNAEIALILMVNHASQELELLAHLGVSEEFALAISGLHVGEGFNGEVAASGRPLVIQDTSRDSRVTRQTLSNEGVRALLIVPLWSKGVIVGTLCVATRQPRQFYAEEIGLLTTVGNVIGVALENARLYEDQKQLAARLRASEMNYRSLFESANEAIWFHDLGGTIVAANDASARLIGCSREELINANAREFLSEENLQIARRVRAQLLRGDSSLEPYDQRLLRKDGTEAIIRLATNLVTADGRPTGFQHIARDVTEETRMRENTRYYIQQVVRAQEEERKRIARELHDDTAQVLGSLSRQLDNFLRKKRPLPADDLFFLRDLQVQLNRGLQAVHRFSQNLRPSVLDDLGLLPALRSLVNETRDRDEVDTEFKVIGTERRFPPEVEVLVFRIVQEALSNIVKHAEASKAKVVMELGGNKIKLRISDNGRGFEVKGRLDDLPRTGKLGIAGMQERARLLGGTLALQSAPGEGTVLTAEIPWVPEIADSPNEAARHP